MSCILGVNAEGHLFKAIEFTSLSSIFDAFLNISPVFLALFFWMNVFSVGKMISFRASRRVLSPVKVWLRACEVLGYEVKGEKVLSQRFLNEIGTMDKGPVFMLDLLFPRILRNKITTIEVG